MSKTRYVEKLKDGGVVIHEITEKVWEVPANALDTQLEKSEGEEKVFLEHVKEMKKGKKKYGLTKTQIANKIKSYKKKLGA